LFGYLIEIPISFPLLSPSVLLLTGLWLWQIHGKQELPPIGKKMEEARRGGGTQGAAEVTQEEQQRRRKRGGRKKRRRNGRKEAAGLKKKKGKNLIYPMVHIKQVTIHSSVLQITGVSSQTVVFQRDLCIRGLRSTIGAMDQKVKFWSTLELV
jgi:hypothetical protein